MRSEFHGSLDTSVLWLKQRLCGASVLSMGLLDAMNAQVNWDMKSLGVGLKPREMKMYFTCH